VSWESWEQFKTEVLQVVGFTGTRMKSRAGRGVTVATQVSAPTLSAFDENFIGPMTEEQWRIMQEFKEDPMNLKLILSSTHGGLMYVTPEEYDVFVPFIFCDAASSLIPWVDNPAN